MLALEYRPRAQVDLDSILLRIGVVQQRPEAALELMKSIDEAIGRARAFPNSASPVRLAGNSLECTYRKILVGSYAIYYRHDEDKLTVCRVLHTRQDIDIRTLADI